MGTTENYVSVMIDSLNKKIEILEQIVIHTEKEKAILLADSFDMDVFENNMQKKSDLIDRLTVLDDGFTSVFNRVRDEINTDRAAYADDIRIMKSLIAGITELSVKIQSEEARNKELAQKQFSLLRKEVKSARKNERMAANYYKSMSMMDSEPQFLDKKK